MFCRNCGKQINDEAVICVNCGTLVDGTYFKLRAASPAAAGVNGAECRNGFALAGFILSFCGVIGWLFSLLGLIFSIIGLAKCKPVKVGKGFGIAGIVISVVAFFVHGVIMMLLMPLLARLIVGPLILIILLMCL